MNHPPPLRLSLLSIAVTAVLLPQAGAIAQSTEQQPEEVIVFGRNLELVGTAEAASEGSVAGADLLVRPMLRVAELLEAVPGMVAVQHSGSGKANQYFLRGFNLDHGTDFSTIIDGVPWNLRSHGHGQGYLDVNGLLPEIVERLDYRKGTYRADVGDFSMAGASFITTIDRLDSPFVALESGENGWARLAAGGTAEAGGGVFTGVAEHKTYDGPWELPEELEHTSMWGKYARPTDFGTLAVTLSGLRRQLASDRADSRARDRHASLRRCFLRARPTATGNTERWIAGCSCPAPNGKRRRTRSTTTGSCSRIRHTTFRSTSSTSAGPQADVTIELCSRCRCSSSTSAVNFATTT